MFSPIFEVIISCNMFSPIFVPDFLQQMLLIIYDFLLHFVPEYLRCTLYQSIIFVPEYLRCTLYQSIILLSKLLWTCGHPIIQFQYFNLKNNNYTYYVEQIIYNEAAVSDNAPDGELMSLITMLPHS